MNLSELTWKPLVLPLNGARYVMATFDGHEHVIARDIASDDAMMIIAQAPQLHRQLRAVRAYFSWEFQTEGLIPIGAEAQARKYRLIDQVTDCLNVIDGYPTDCRGRAHG